MHKIKHYASTAWLVLQVIVIAYLWTVLAITAFYDDVRVTDYIRLEWWITFFMLDLWTARIFIQSKEDSVLHS